MKQVWQTEDGKIWDTVEQAGRWETREILVKHMARFLLRNAYSLATYEAESVSQVIIDNFDWFTDIFEQYSTSL